MVIFLGLRALDNAKNNFERGKEDVFTLQSADLGELKRVRISHDNSGASPGSEFNDN